MKETIKKVGLYFLCAIVLAAIRVYAQSGPPKCGGISEPPVYDMCGIGGPDGVCTVNPNPCYVTKYGRNYEYCCYEPKVYSCTEVMGRWKCCYDPIAGEHWVPECRVIVSNGNACDEHWEHCL